MKFGKVLSRQNVTSDGMESLAPEPGRVPPAEEAFQKIRAS